MENVGPSLRALAEATFTKCLSMKLTIYALIQMLYRLEALHEAGYVYRDMVFDYLASA
jgi:hypothetical protein